MDIADDWFVGFQTELKARFWHAAAEPFADAEAKAIAGLLDLPAGARVLDAPCGGGRIAVRLAERGLDVLGIDISEWSARGAGVAAERGVGARSSGRHTRAAEQAFDAVVHWGNSFGTCPRRTIEHLASMRRRCEPAGGSCWRA